VQSYIGNGNDLLFDMTQLINRSNRKSRRTVSKPIVRKHKPTGLPELLLAKGANLVRKRAKKESNSKIRGQKMGQPFFPILSAIAKSYETILSNLSNGNIPQSQL